MLLVILYPQGLLVAYAAGEAEAEGRKQEVEVGKEEAPGRVCVSLVVLLSLMYLCALAVFLYYVATQGEFGQEGR